VATWLFGSRKQAFEKDIVVLDEYFLSYALFEGPSTVCHEMWVFAC
jgi:hypothetical protein